MSTVEFSDVTFKYTRGAPVFEQLSLAVPRGSTVLLGPNGAGKTTFLKLSAGALLPQRGVVELDGLRSASRRDRRAYRGRVSFMPQQIRPIPGLSVRHQVAYVGWLKGLSRHAAWSAAAQALERVSLDDDGDRMARDLSGGQLRRLGVAQAIVRSADVLLMDEPTAGLDPEQRARFRELLARLRTSSSLVVSTHQTEDITESYDHVVVVIEGRIRYVDSVTAFLSQAGESVPDGKRAEAAYSAVLEASRR